MNINNILVTIAIVLAAISGFIVFYLIPSVEKKKPPRKKKLKNLMESSK
jgi:phosphotransferase system  glucose/maltose/N-acetylglucosamine-specific IIC component